MRIVKLVLVGILLSWQYETENLISKLPIKSWSVTKEEIGGNLGQRTGNFGENSGVMNIISVENTQ